MAEVKKFYYVNDPDVIVKDTKGIASDPTSRYLLNPSNIIEHLDGKLDKANLSTEIQAYIQAGEGIHIEEVIGEDEHHTPHLVIKTTGGAAIDLSEYAKKSETVAKTDYDTKVAAIDEAVATAEGKVNEAKQALEDKIARLKTTERLATIDDVEEKIDTYANSASNNIQSTYARKADLPDFSTLTTKAELNEYKNQAELEYLKLEDIETKMKAKGFITQADLQPILDAIKALKGE